MAYTPEELQIAQRNPHRALAANIGRGAQLPPPGLGAAQPPGLGAAAAAPLGADAFARGGDVHVADARPHLLAHEAAHVVQQQDPAAAAAAVGGFNRP